MFLKKAEKSRSTDCSRWNCHLVKHIGKTRISTLTVQSAKRLYHGIANTQEQHDTGTRGIRTVGGAGTARKALRLVSAMLTFAVEQGHLAVNPLIHQLRLEGDGQREAILAQGDYAKVFDVTEEMVAEGVLRTVQRDAILFIAATGCRRGEAQKLKWRHIDAQSRLATLSNTEHKTGRKTKGKRIIGLVPMVLEILERRRQENESTEPDDLVFPPKEGERIELNHVWRRIRHRVGLGEEIVIHSLRHSLASHAAMAGLSAHELMAAMGHRQISTTTKYVSWAEEKARVHDRAATAALGSLALGSQAKETTADVIHLRRDEL